MNKTQRLITILTFVIIPAMVQSRSFARWHTSMGSFTAELYDEMVPITANNFKNLANQDFYNNLIFHRVISGFMIQDGCPQGTGYGGPGYTIQDEFHPDLLHDSAGVLAMARTSAPNSAGSQYYITLAPTPHLDGGYAVFGRIIEGLENVMAIGSVPTGANNRPITPVDIYQLRMLDLQIANLFPPPEESIQLLSGETQFFYIEAVANSADITYQWFLNDDLLEEDSFLTELSFPAGNNLLRCNIASSDSIAFDAVWNILVSSSAEDLQSPVTALLNLNASPNPFAGTLNIALESKNPQMISVELFNLRGQKLRTLQAPTLKHGSWNILWDGKDTAGKDQPAGLYLLRVKSPGGSVYRKVTKQI